MPHSYPMRTEFRGDFVQHFLMPDNATRIKYAQRDRAADVVVVDDARKLHLTAALHEAATLHSRGALYVEFGVHRGESIDHLASLNRSLYWHGFDSFHGLPSDRRDEARARPDHTRLCTYCLS